MDKPLDRTKITSAIVRKALGRSNMSNIAVARECKISISQVRTFRAGNDMALSTIERIRVFTLLRKGTF
jgi:hypothetical protein